MNIEQDTEQERQNKVSACKYYSKINDEGDELASNFREISSKSYENKEQNESLIKKIFTDVIVKKFSSKLIKIDLNEKEQKIMRDDYEMYIRSILFSKSGVGILEGNYSQRGRYDIGFDKIRTLLFVFKEKIAQRLSKENFDNLCEFLDLYSKFEIIEKGYEEIPKEEINEILTNSQREDNDENDNHKWLYYLIFYDGNLSLGKAEKEGETIDKVLKSYWYRNKITNLGGGFLGNLFYSSCKNRLLNFYEKVKAKQEEQILKNEEQMKKIKERYKDELMLMALKESNKK